jgi:hypothetical protein
MASTSRFRNGVRNAVTEQSARPEDGYLSSREPRPSGRIFRLAARSGARVTQCGWVALLPYDGSACETVLPS